MALVVAGLEDMPEHFRPCQLPCTRYGRRWIMVWMGREVRSRTDYILGMDLRLFRNVSSQDPRHNSDHYFILACLCSDTLREHAKYLGRCT